jgi:hypothetical protein
MHLHFTTSLNGPWQFEGHGLTITDSDGAVDSGYITVTKVNENCNGVHNCVQEWRMKYVTGGVCDPDGMHKLELTPYSGAILHEEPLQVTIALLSHGCGRVDETGKHGVDNIHPITPYDTEPSSNTKFVFEVWSSHTHTEVQTMEWKKIQEEEVTIFHEFQHKLEEVVHASHDNFVITIHEASEVK